MVLKVKKEEKNYFISLITNDAITKVFPILKVHQKRTPVKCENYYMFRDIGMFTHKDVNGEWETTIDILGVRATHSEIKPQKTESMAIRQVTDFIKLISEERYYAKIKEAILWEETESNLDHYVIEFSKLKLMQLV